MVQWTEDQYAYYVWKPHGIPSTFGKEYSFLEELMDKRPPFFVALMDKFSKDEEFGLMNRLDNDTAGFLYFAKNYEAKAKFSQMIEEGKLQKMYLCCVQGLVDVTYYNNRESIGHILLGDYIDKKYQDIMSQKISFFADIESGVVDQGIIISTPIMHSKSSSDRMIVIKEDVDMVKGRGNRHQCTTRVYPISMSPDKKSTLCIVLLEGGIRHQIRVHLASIGHPVQGDVLYGKGRGAQFLQLFSAGVIYDQMVK